MITITNMRNPDIGKGKFDEVWAIVRSAKKLNTATFKHVPVLSPSWNLFKHYMELRNANNWNHQTFQSDYVPVFMREMQSPAAQQMLQHLIQLHETGKSIALVYFCPDETLCHRSILAGILQARGIPVNGVAHDYSHYGPCI